MGENAKDRMYDTMTEVVARRGEEAALLRHDVELAAFPAREVLSASARPLGSEAVRTP